MRKLLESGIVPFRSGVFLDIYHQTINEDVSMAIRTTIDQSNLHYVTVIEDETETDRRQTP